MTNLTKALFRIDPSEGLVEYIKVVKPYHSKILDINVGYIYDEPIISNVRDSTPQFNITHALGGYGLVWETSGISTTIQSADPNTNVFGVTSIISVPYDFTVISVPTNDMIFVSPPEGWPPGAAVMVSSTGTLPAPLLNTTTYYYIPTSITGTYVLATTRYPNSLADFVLLTSIGSGTLQIFRTEPFIPGETVIVTASSGGLNDGGYTVQTIAPNGVDWSVEVTESIPTSVPDGVITSGSFGV